jgi:hypothetical protein
MCHFGYLLVTAAHKNAAVEYYRVNVGHTYYRDICNWGGSLEGVR